MDTSQCCVCFGFVSHSKDAGNLACGCPIHLDCSVRLMDLDVHECPKCKAPLVKKALPSKSWKDELTRRCEFILGTERSDRICWRAGIEAKSIASRLSGMDDVTLRKIKKEHDRATKGQILLNYVKEYGLWKEYIHIAQSSKTTEHLAIDFGVILPSSDFVDSWRRDYLKNQLKQGPLDAEKVNETVLRMPSLTCTNIQTKILNTSDPKDKMLKVLDHLGQDRKAWTEWFEAVGLELEVLKYWNIVSKEGK